MRDNSIMQKLRIIKIKFKSLTLTLLISSLYTLSYSQKRQILPIDLKEISGIEVYNDSTLICHNDSGNNPNLYIINKKGKIKDSKVILAKNKDWEDICKDNIGNYYLADIGNNFNKRDTLSILVFKNTELKKDTIKNISIINFSYSINEIKKNFDCESIFYYNDYLYLLTKIKHRKDDVNIFKIKIKNGFQNAEYVSSFKIPKQKSFFLDAICSAKEYKEKLYILTYSKLYEIEMSKIINKIKKEDFKIIKRFIFLSQKEALCIDKDNFYIANERSTTLRKQKIHKINGKTKN